jgi:hypothetical protein
MIFPLNSLGELTDDGLRDLQFHVAQELARREEEEQPDPDEDERFEQADRNYDLAVEEKLS